MFISTRKSFLRMFVVACLASIGSIPTMAQVATKAPVAGSTTGPTAAQRRWLAASPAERIKIAEEIGERGARKMAKAQGYVPLFDGRGRTLPQGPDQVYRGSNGRVIVYESKGGTSPLGRGYGYAQGTSEWAVESAKRVLRSPKAGPAEKAAAKEIIEAAARGKLEVHVVRTKHVLGQPTAAVLEATSVTTDDAARLARLSLTQTGGKSVGKSARGPKAGKNGCVAGPWTPKPKLAGAASKALVGVGVVVDAKSRYSKARTTEKQFSEGKITQQQRMNGHSRNAAGMIGGWSGAFAGAKLGGAGGAMIAGPWGSGIGAFFFGVAGYFGGEAAVGSTAGWISNRLQRAGQ